VVPWARLHSVGADAVTVDSHDALLKGVPPAERDGLTPHVGDRPVLTESGTRIGQITSYELDEKTGHLQRFHINTGGILGRLTHSEVVFGRGEIRSFGKDAILVADSVLGAPATS